MATQSGTLKAGYQLYIDIANGDSSTVFDYTVTGASVRDNCKAWKSDRVIGAFSEDVAFTVTYTGSPVIYKVQPDGQREYTATTLPDPATVGVGTVVAVGTSVAMAIGGDWHYMPQAKGAIVLDSSTSGDDSGWLPSSVNPERFGFLLTGASAVVAITGSDDADSVAAGYAVTVTMDTAASTLVTPPMNFDYKFIKFTVMSLGASSSIKVSRGV